MEKGPGFLVDAHAHLDLLDRAHEEIRNAVANGVRAIIGVSMGIESMEKTVLLKRAFPDVVLPAFGLHPWQIDKEEVGNALEKLEDNLKDAVAIGEIGLDYRIKTKKAVQKEVFQKQLMMAREKALPVIVHCRYSHPRALKLVEEAEISRAVFHWYTGPVDLIETIVDRGYFLSATPALGYSQKHQEAIRAVPLDNLLLETDCPVAYQGEEAVPSDVIRVCDQVASLKNCSVVEVARQTSENVQRFLGMKWAERLT